MTPQEISTILHQSTALQQTFHDHRAQVWQFLRVFVHARFDCYPVGAHTCGRCGIQTYPTLASPYNAWNPGWCIECVLEAFFTEAPFYDPRRDPEAPEYDARYAQECQFWEDLDAPEDGPPIALA